MNSGFYLIGHLIYDLARIKLYKLAASAEDYGTIVGVKTDAAFLRSYVAGELPTDMVGPFEIGDAQGCGFADIEKVKIERGVIPNNLIKFVSSQDVIQHVEPYICAEPTIIEIGNEWDTAELNGVFDVNNVLIKALYPGCGKTTSLTTMRMLITVEGPYLYHLLARCART